MVIQFEMPIRDRKKVQTDLAGSVAAPVLIDVPESWCFTVLRAAPRGGWATKVRKRLRPGLFPDLGGGALNSDEEISPSGAWHVWALPEERIQRALGDLAPLVFSGKRIVRIRPKGHRGDGLAAFPNLAPRAFRAFRWPVRSILRFASVGTPLAVLVAAAGGTWFHLRAERSHLLARVQEAEAAASAEQAHFQAESQLTEALGSMKTSAGQMPPWLSDLDAFTRLLPEDTRLARIRWSPSVIEVEVVTPHPQAIQAILEGSSEFKNIQFVGRLDRQGELTRMTLDCSRAEKK